MENFEINEANCKQTKAKSLGSNSIDGVRIRVTKRRRLTNSQEHLNSQRAIHTYENG